MLMMFLFVVDVRSLLSDVIRASKSFFTDTPYFLPFSDLLLSPRSYTVKCWSFDGQNHLWYIGWASLFLIIYVIAFPIVLFWALHMNRQAIYDKDAPDHERVHRRLGPFADQYEPEYYYFEVLVILRKLLLTGLVRLIAPGSAPQIMIALIVCVAYMCLVLKTAPFEQDLDDWLSFITECQLSLTMFLGFAILTDTNNVLDRGMLDGFLVAVNCCGIFAFIVGSCIENKAHEKVKIVHNRVRRSSISVNLGAGVAALVAAGEEVATAGGAATGSREGNGEPHSSTRIVPVNGSRITIVSPATLQSIQAHGGSNTENDFTLP